MSRHKKSYSGNIKYGRGGLCILLIINWLCIFFGAAPAQEITDSVLNERTRDFGYLPQKSEVNHRFYIHNTGTAPLNVEKIKAGCSCTSVSKIDKPIAPGDSAAVDITFKSGRYLGKVKKTTEVYIKDREKPLYELHIKADVIKQGEEPGAVRVEPEKLKWEIKSQENPIAMDSLMLVNNGPDSLTVSILHLPDTIVNQVYYPETIGPKERKNLILQIEGESLKGKAKGNSITVAFYSKDTTIVTVPIEIKK